MSTVAPQWNVWGFMRDQSLAMLYAVVVFASFLFTGEKLKFKWRPEVIFMLLLIVAVCVSMFYAINVDEGYRKWTFIMKTMLLVLAAVYALNTRRHVEALAATLAFSIGFFGIKGGVFTLATGGEYLVHGPNPSWENNGWAVATILAIPLLAYFYMQANARWKKWALGVTIALSTLSVFGSFSRGGFLAIVAMFTFLWWRSNRKVLAIVVLVPLVAVGVLFMPAKWEERMQTIQTYQSDGSAMGRINAWTMLFNAANDHPLVGLGPYPYIPEVFNRYAPNPEDIHSAHSMYFEVLGENGYPALFFFLMMWLYTWRDASWIIRCSKTDDLIWARRLAAMIQVSIVGHVVGGAFLANAYFEPVYYYIVLIVVLRYVVEQRLSSQQVVAGVPGPGSPTPQTRLSPERG